MDEILKESVNALRAHFHPGWNDRTLFDVFTRLLAKNIRRPNWQPTDHESVTPDQITSRREWWTIEELAKLTRGHSRDEADHENEPIVLAIHEGQQRLLDGNTRINMWVKRKDANGHQVNIHVIESCTMTVKKRIEQSEELILWLDRLIEDLSVPANNRAVIAAACQDIALEHHKSIVLTSRSTFHGSAFALVRLQFEAYVRGAWIRYCASDKQVVRLKEQDKLDRNFGELISNLESEEAFNVGVLSQIKANSWKDMNSFTHTGLQQIVRRITSAEVGSRYPDKEIVGTLDFADSIALLATLAIVDLTVGEPAIKEKLATQLLECMSEFAGESEP